MDYERLRWPLMGTHANNLKVQYENNLDSIK